MKKFVRVYLKGGETYKYVDFPVGDNVLFPNFMAQFRFEGYAASNDCFVPFDECRCAFFGGSEELANFTKRESTLQ